VCVCVSIYRQMFTGLSLTKPLFSCGSFMKFIVAFVRRKIFLLWIKQNFSVYASLLKQRVS